MEREELDGLVNEVLEDLNVQSMGVPDEDLTELLKNYAQELAEGVTAERDAEIAEGLFRAHTR